MGGTFDQTDLGVPSSLQSFAGVASAGGVQGASPAWPVPSCDMITATSSEAVGVSGFFVGAGAGRSETLLCASPLLAGAVITRCGVPGGTIGAVWAKAVPDPASNRPASIPARAIR